MRVFSSLSVRRAFRAGRGFEAPRAPRYRVRRRSAEGAPPRSGQRDALRPFRRGVALGRAVTLGGPRFQAGENDPARRPARPSAGAGCFRQRRRRHPRDGERRAARVPSFPSFSAVSSRAGAGSPRSRESARCGRRRPAVARRAELEQRLLGRLAEGPEARALVGRRLEGERHEEGADAAAPGAALSAAPAGRARAPLGWSPFSRQNGSRAKAPLPPAPGLGRDPGAPARFTLCR